MAKFTKDEFIAGLKEMTILEVKELVDALKEEFGVDPSALAVAAPAAAAESEEPSTVNINLVETGANKLAVIKLIRDLTGLGLKEAKEIADNTGVVKENVPFEEAKEAQAKFEEAGAKVELK